MTSPDWQQEAECKGGRSHGGSYVVIFSEEAREEHGRAIFELGSERERLEEAQNEDEWRVVWMKEQLAEVEETLVPADRKSTRLNSSHSGESRMPSSA